MRYIFYNTLTNCVLINPFYCSNLSVPVGNSYLHDSVTLSMT